MGLLRDSYASGGTFGNPFDNGAQIDAANDWYAQNFIASASYVAASIKLPLSRGTGDSPGTVTVALYAIDGNGKPTGAALASGTTSGDTLSQGTTAEWREVTFSSSVSLTSSTEYAIVLSCAGAGVSDVINWFYTYTASPAQEEAWNSTDGGSSWAQRPSAQGFGFAVYDDFTPPVGVPTKKYLVAFGNNCLEYEDLAVAEGNMTQLAASVDDIDTSAQLQAFEAYGKVFVVNGSNLKVFDPTNTKITTANVGANPPDHGNILTDGTSGAKMVVDYVTSLSGACTIYGYRTTTATFGTGNTVTGTDDDGNAISFALNANETAPSPPHWYDWTTYGGSTDYGTMPDQANLGCLSGGRCMLSGDRDYPHQIRASAIDHPWDWNVNRTTATRAVPIGAGDEGAIGDVVRALIPARDGYLHAGCASSVHLIAGNPADGGQILAIDKTVGVFDGTSFCFDGDGNLYFWGTSGIYRLRKGATDLEPLSRGPLPNLIEDEAADPTTHRVTMGYDSVRVGIKICITLLADGTSSNYWFDLQTEAFCPDEHQQDHGVYSLFNYDANDTTLKGLLMGCKDGYIRVHDDDADDDDGSAIDSYVWFGPLAMSEPGREGTISNVQGVLAGGAAGGSAVDSDDVTFQVFADESAEDIIEAIDDSTAVPKFAGTLSLANTRRRNRRRQKARGTYAAIKLGNSANDETWGLEQLIVGG